VVDDLVGLNTVSPAAPTGAIGIVTITFRKFRVPGMICHPAPEVAKALLRQGISYV